MARVTYTENLQHTNATDFRLWGKNFSDALSTSGLVQTADTGQIDWGTVPFPASGGTGGYEMYAFTSAMQATRPYFLKVEYGTSWGYANRPRLSITVCTKTDGAGGVVGLYCGAESVNNRSILIPNASETFISHSADDQIAILWGVRSASSYPNACMGVLIGRPVDDAGLVVSDGLYLAFTEANSGASWNWAQFIQVPTLVQAVSNCSAGCQVIPGFVATTSRGLEIQTFRHFFSAGRPRNVPVCVSYLDAEMPPNSEFDLAVIPGVSRHYLALGGAAWAFSLGCGGASNDNQARAVLAVLWEN